MLFRGTKAAGVLLFVGATQFTIAALLAEALYPNYSTSNNYISDLGVWSNASAAIFNPSIIFSGTTTLISAYLIKSQISNRLFPIILALSGIGSIAVGIFPENTFIVNGIPIVHSIAAFMAFIFGAASAIVSYRITNSPFRYLSVILGIVSLTAFVLLIFAGIYGFSLIGAGTLERMVAYPTLLWTIGFAGYLLGTE